MKALLVYFSRAGENYNVGNIEVGNTKIIAKYIKDLTGCEEFELLPEKPYPISYEKTIQIAKEEERTDARPHYLGEIKTDKYDTIYLGFPIWWDSLPKIVCTFLKNHDLRNKTIYPFCTHEGSKDGKSVNDIQKLCPYSKIGNPLSIEGSRVKVAKDEVKEWLNNN